MNDDNSWFHDPAELRRRADEYDSRASSGTDPHSLTVVWQGKARVLRSRARAIERAAAQVGRNPKGQDPKGLGAKHEHAVLSEAKDAPNE